VIGPGGRSVAYAAECDGETPCEIRIVGVDGKNDRSAAQAALSVNGAPTSASRSSFLWLRPHVFYTVARAGLGAVDVGGVGARPLASRPFRGDPVYAWQTFFAGSSRDGSRVAITTKATWPRFVVVWTSSRGARTLRAPSKNAAIFLP
jgi:hypothetical protein